MKIGDSHQIASLNTRLLVVLTTQFGACHRFSNRNQLLEPSVKRYWTSSVLAIVLSSSSAAIGENWPQFCGQGSLGVSGEKGLPIRWSSSENVSWKTPLPGPGHSSPIVWGDRIFLTAFQPTMTSRLLSYVSSSRDGKLLTLCLDRKDGKEAGILMCLSAKTGELVYQKRLPATGGYYASPIASEGKIYTLSERGETCVLEEGAEFKILATNEVGERCMASPAVSRDQIFIRSDSTLFGIGTPGL